jgi:hypothetical protein
MIRFVGATKEVVMKEDEQKQRGNEPVTIEPAPERGEELAEQAEDARVELSDRNEASRDQGYGPVSDS